MKFNINEGAVDYPTLTTKLQEKFPNYTFKMRGKSFLVGSSSNSCGANIMIRKKKIFVTGNFPTMGGQMLFALGVVLLGFLIPLIIYFAAFHGKMKAFEKEIGDFLQSEYGQEVT